MRLLQNLSSQVVELLDLQSPSGTALLVDPDPFILADRHQLLMRYCKVVHTVTTSGGVYELQPKEEPFVVVLGNALGGFHLQAVTEYIRHRWPHARILIVGDAVPYLEDQLYDEIVHAPASDSELLLAFEKCKNFMM